MAEIKTIGIITSGNDAPGMNCAIRAVTRAAIYNGLKVKAVYHGYKGLIEGDIVEFETQSVSNIIQYGGTILKSSPSKEFKNPEGRKKAYENLVKENIDALIVIGGDGTIHGARIFAQEFDFPCIAIPATIDNDVGCSNYTIGFDTACNTAIECIDKLRDTMQSHERCSVVEVMGRNAGFLALYVGIAVGATAVLVPEREMDFQRDVIERIRSARLAGSTHFMIVVAEGVGSAVEIGKQIHEAIGIEPRVTVLGHIQRGGTPNARDRETATRMGYFAVKAFAEGRGNCVIGTRGGDMVETPIEEALQMKKHLQMDRYHVLETVSVTTPYVQPPIEGR